MRRVVPLLILALLLSGCWSRIEVNDLAIVGLVGIDRTEDGQIQLWINVIVPAKAGGAPGAGMTSGAQGSPFVTLTATGPTVLQAANRIQTQLPRRIFWAHARVILIGERLAREGSRLVVDFLTRHRELRLTNFVLVVPGEMTDVLSNRVDLERLPSEYMREIERNRIVPVSTLRDWVRDLASNGADPLLAVVDAVEPPAGAASGQRPGLRIERGALFHSDRLVEYASYEIAQGILWLRGEIHVGVVTVKLPEAPGGISVEWLESRTERKVRMENGRPVIYVHVRTEGDVTEEQGNLDLGDPSQLRRIEPLLNKEIKARIERALALMRELNVDSAALGEEIHRQQPAAWKRMAATWHEEGFRKTRVVVSVDARVRRTGLSAQPQGVRDDELIKGRK